MFRLGLVYTKRHRVEDVKFCPNHAEAVRWLRKAAEQGYANAQCGLGLRYAQGRGVPRITMRPSNGSEESPKR